MRVQPSLVDGEEGAPPERYFADCQVPRRFRLAYSLQSPLRDHQVAVMAIVAIARPLPVVERSVSAAAEGRRLHAVVQVSRFAAGLIFHQSNSPSSQVSRAPV